MGSGSSGVSAPKKSKTSQDVNVAKKINKTPEQDTSPKVLDTTDIGIIQYIFYLIP